jgi:hypothetical protein
MISRLTTGADGERVRVADRCCEERNAGTGEPKSNAQHTPSKVGERGLTSGERRDLERHRTVYRFV